MNEDKLRDYLKRVTADLQRTRQRLAEAEARDHEPIAVVGMACRFPGGATTPQGLWELVAEGRDAVGAFPEDRGWDTDNLFDSDPDTPGTSYAREGGFLYDAAEFDPDFFDISPREALALDPQQRLLLETTWESIESAGIAPASLRGSRTGVFSGVSGHEYASLTHQGAEDVEGYLLTGNTLSVASGRVAYTLGLEGPAVTVDTACSSSLVALHMACQSLRKGESFMALAGGAAVMATPGMFVEFSRQRGLALDSRCKSFSAAADGVAWAEGAGMVLLERLSDAEANGHPILAVIRGSAVNQDGKSSQLTAPNGPSQQRVIQAALTDAGLTSDQIDAVEAHGTGTSLGDPIEAQALLATYGQHRRPDQPLWLGSFKSNIGHAQAAAGIGGVIKMIQGIRRGVLPKTLHVDEPSPHIDWTSGDVRLLTEQRPWPETDHPRRAAVSSFGISGTNSHLILEEAPVREQAEEPETELPAAGGIVPWLLSGKNEQALRDQARQLRIHLGRNPELRPAETAHALATTRTLFQHRAVLVADDTEQFAQALDALAQGNPSPAVVQGTPRSGKTAFLFTGQGSQRSGMGRGLYETQPVFRAAFDEACAGLDRYLGTERPLKDIVFDDDQSLLNQTRFTQAGLFAVETALYRLVESFGIVPDYLTGHSIGELTAAHIAGVLSLDDACRLVAARGTLMQALPATGTMISLRTTEEQVRPLLKGREHQVSIAAINGPASTVISGDDNAVTEIAATLAEQGIKTKRLTVSHAFHSPHMDTMLAEFERVATGLDFQPPTIPIVSNLTGQLADPQQLTTLGYWVRHVREAVRFHEGIRTLHTQGVSRFVELGPDGTLTSMAQDSLTEHGHADVTFIPVLHRERDEQRTFLTALGTAHTRGIPIGWTRLFAGTPRTTAFDLPTYPFQRQRYWLGSSRAGLDAGHLGLTVTGHPVLTTLAELPDNGGHLFTGRVSVSDPDWVPDHAVFGAAIVPGVAFVDLLLHAAEHVGCDRIDELIHHIFLAVPEHGALQLRVLIEPADASGQRPLSVYSRSEDAPADSEWTLHATGALATRAESAPQSIDGIWPSATAERIDVDEFYTRISDAGLGYGPQFRRLQAAWQEGDTTWAEVSLPADASPGAYGIHPGLLDSVLQPGALVTHEAAADTIRIPFSWSGVSLHTTGARNLRVRLVWTTPETVSLDITDHAGTPVLTVESLAMRAVAADQVAAAHAANAGELYRVDWVTIPTPTGPTPSTIDARWADATTPGNEHLTATPTALAPKAPVVAPTAEGGTASGSEVFVTWCVAREDADPVQATHALTQHVLGLVQRIVSDDERPDSRLVVLTRNATSTGPSDRPADLAGASVWGLLRSVQAEHPDRFTLVDLDQSEASLKALPRALATAEPQLAVRNGQLLGPRLAHGEAATEPARFDPEKTVLITGGTGGLGRLLAHHLVTTHGVKHLLLISRKGPKTPSSIVTDLAALGARVTIAACDAADEKSLASLLDSLPHEHPLGAVVHCAGVLDDGIATALTPERLAGVLRPKVDAAWNLHRLTRDKDLDAFVLFSSAVGTLGAPGQSNYGAANGFLDALARHRHASGLPAKSLAWGLWEDTAGGMAGTLDQQDRARMGRNGLLPIPADLGLAHFDAALVAAEPVLVPAKFDLAGLRTRAASAPLPPMFRGLIRTPIRAAAQHTGAGQDVDALRQSLAGRPEAEQHEILLRFLRGHVATVLGHNSPDAIDADVSFKELGFDSLSSVELRNALNKASGMRLPSTLLFDYPTPTTLATHIRAAIADTAHAAAVTTRKPIVPASVTSADEPIAIVGMACRFPGGANTPEDLWQLVAEGRDAVGAFPEDRGWDLENLFDPDPDALGKSYAREGGFLYDAADFDPEFFGISPREALALDPQQRLLLETTWETLENAGIAPASLRGSDTAVFTGVVTQEYASLTHHGSERVEGYLLTGTTASVASGRLAFTFGLEGPAVTVDTACSSSLVALHMACQSLRNGESSMALAGGATVMANEGMFLEFSRQRGLALDSRCKSFSAAADGVAWAEGAGMVLLERLSDAQANGHPILAVIRGTAVNQDGASNGLTAPNGPSQQRVIHAALANAGLTTGEIDAVEAHGTGTTLGDPIEAQALLATYGQNRAPDQPLWLGSFKSNIGHAQAAAGIGGVIKMIQAMHHGTLPKTLHVDEPSPHIDWTSGNIQLLTEQRPWPETDHPRRAAVSSFGISGTNSHIILEEAPVRAHTEEEREQLASEVTAVPWLLSARNEQALRDQARQLHTHLGRNPELRPAETAHALATTRTLFQHRAVLVADDTEQFARALDALAQGNPSPAVVQGTPRSGKTAFLFTGQGSQRSGMGRRLYDTQPVFRAAFDEAGAGLDVHLAADQPLRDLLFAADQPLVHETKYAQAGLFAIETALYRLVESFGIVPDYLTGHSIGELTAAHIAGVLSLDDACRLVAARGTLMQALPATGAMISLRTTEEQVRPLLEGREHHVSIAAVNGPASTVISGDDNAVTEIAATLAEQGVKTKRLTVSHAFHSPHMDAMLTEFERVATGLDFQPPTTPIVSNLTGQLADPQQLTTPGYWVRHVREAVRFHNGIQTLHTHGVRHFIELGPDGTLTTMAQDSLTEHGDTDATFIPVLHRERDEQHTFLTALGTAHTRGIPIDWTRLLGDTSPVSSPGLPTYPFQRQHYWLETSRPEAGQEARASASGLAATSHPVLTTLVELPDSGHLFTGRISATEPDWIPEHAITGALILPGAAYVDLLLHTAEHVDCAGIDELTHHMFLAVPEHGAVQLRVLIAPADESGRRPLTVHSRPEEAPSRSEWTLHASGWLADRPRNADTPATVANTVADDALSGAVWPPAGAEPVDMDEFYRRIADAGLDYGPRFRGLRAAWQDGDTTYGELALPEGAAPGAYGIHPGLLDSAIQPGALGRDAAADSVRVPFFWSGVSLHATGAAALRVRLTRTATETASLAITDPAGTPVLTIDSLTMREVAPEHLAAARATGTGRLHGLDWAALPVRKDAASGALVATWAETGTPGNADLALLADPVALPLADGGAAAEPEVFVAWCAAREDADPVRATHALTRHVLGLVQRIVSDDERPDARLVVLTRDATAAGPDDRPVDLAGAAVWSLLRSVQAEHLDRFILVDLDGAESSVEALPAAVASGEPQVAVRAGRLLAPRLAHRDAATEPARFDPEKTVLITGGTGGLGRLLAHHLVTAHGVKHLLLTSRKGPKNGSTLVTDLAALGAKVTVAACDAADEKSLASLLGSLPDEHPLGAVIHCAGVLDDGIAAALTPERLSGVLRPKVDAAWNLHRLTRDRNLDAFVLFSSVTGTLGAPGQSNYAAANGFLDALARHRHASGLPAKSLAWGVWADTAGGMADTLEQQDRARMSRTGLLPIAADEGLAHFDAALTAPEPVLIPATFDLAGLRARATATSTPVAPVFRGLIRTPIPAATQHTGADQESNGLRQSLAGHPEPEQQRILLAFLRGHIATVLGHSSPDAINPQTPFKELGFDSLSSVELRNALNKASGMRLPSTVLFDYPNSTALAQHIRAALADTGQQAATAPKPTAARATRSTANEPIAIVSMACRYPGGVSTPDDLWQLVAEGRDAVGTFPEDRGWDLENLYDPDPDAPGKTYAREGGFLYDAADFDPEFFGISPREATAMDPQQRLLLETSWEALERAKVDPEQLRGSDTGVFMGATAMDYGPRLFQGDDGLGGYLLTGSTVSVASGRVAYTFGLEGPAVTVDTACSSSLVALHQAAQALRNGECSLALAGGVTVMSTPGMFVEVGHQRGLAADGRCKSFSAAADGVIWAEGAGMVLLERLSDAQANGHPILAVIRGSAVNQDGASNGLSAPNGPSQQRVIRAALANAGLGTGEIDAVEAHGTGTSLGDPIEAQALLATYGQDRAPDQPLWLGSLKSNIGHPQAAAGVGGVIKMVQAIRHSALPRTLHVAEPSPHIDWTSGNVRLLTEQQPWPETGRPRRGAVSSFGISGTNAHLILEEAPIRTADAGADGQVDGNTARAAQRGPVPWLVSAKTGEALRDQVTRLLDHVAAHPDLGPTDIAHALVASGGTAFEHRAVAVGSTHEELVADLRAAEHQRAQPEAGRTAFLFTGQGAQRSGMGRGLYETYPVFRAAFDEVCAGLDVHLAAERPLTDVIFDDDQSLLNQTRFTQAALFAVEMALYRLVESFGIVPDYLTGHSIGELTAAHIAGVLSLDDACRLVAARGTLMQALPATGAMISLRTTEEQVRPLLEGREHQVSIAAVNGPASTVISGDDNAVTEIAATLAEQGIKTKRLTVSHAFHSPHMDAMLTEFERVATGLDFQPPTIPIVSNLTGQLADPQQLTTPGYWVRHVREAVRFHDGIRTLHTHGVRHFIELGPDGTLTSMAREALSQAGGTAVPLLDRNRHEATSLVRGLAQAHADGVTVGWQEFFSGAGVAGVELPTYAFQRRRYWLDAPTRTGSPAGLGLESSGHPMLATSTELPDGSHLFTGRVSLAGHPWLGDHVVMGTVILPGTAFIELALHAAVTADLDEIAELVLNAPITFGSRSAALIQMILGPEDRTGGRALTIRSRAETDHSWTENATGTLSAGVPVS